MGVTMNLWVVVCEVEGCEECGNSMRVVGVFDDETKAEKVRKEHTNVKHLHSPYVHVYPLALNEFYHLNQAGYC
jgi:hypothetical protein